MTKKIEKMKKNLDATSLLPDVLARKISSACRGLVYISETDAPVKLFYGDPADRADVATLREQSNLASASPVIEQEPRSFFRKLTQEMDWYGPAERRRAEKFLELRELLEEHLEGLTVFKVGSVRVQIYVLGIAKGRLMGVRTEAVET